MASSTRNQGSVRAPFVNINQLTRSGASNGDVPVFNSPRWGVGEGGGGGAARYIEPYITFGRGPSTHEIWEMAPPNLLLWVTEGEEDTEGRWTRGIYRFNGTDTPERVTEYDETVPLTNIYLRGVAWQTAEHFLDVLNGGELNGVGPINVEYKFPDWNATQTPYGDSVGADSEAVFVGYQPENYGLPGPSLSLANHLAGIDNAIGEQFLDSVYVPTSGPLVDLLNIEGQVETPGVLTLTGNTVHVRSVDQDHTGKTILVECTLVDQHDRSGRRLKGFEMVGTASNAYSFALTLNGNLTPLDGSAWGNGHREDLGAYIGFGGKAVAVFNDSDGHPFSRSAQFTSPIPSNDLDDHRISIIVTTGLNPTFNGVIEMEFEIVPIWEDANEVYTPDDPAKWESLDPGDPEVPETKREGLDLLVHTVVDLLDTVADLAAPGVKVVTEIELDAWDYEVKPGDRHVYFDPSIDHAYTVGVSGLLGGVAFQETWLYNDSAVFNLEVETAFLVSPGQAMHIIWNGTTYTAHVLDAPTAL